MTRFFQLQMAALMVLMGWVPALHAGINWAGSDGGTTSAPLDWNTPANWTGGNVPNAITEIATFADSATGRVVMTPATATSVVAMGLTQSSNAVSRLMLGADLTLVGGNYTAADRSWNNSSGNADNLVLDLNGHVFNITTGAPPVINGPMTITSSAAGGVFKHSLAGNLVVPAGWSGLKVGPNVTLQAEGTVAGKSIALASAGTWDESTTLYISGTAVAGVQINSLPTAGIGNLIVGDSTKTDAANLTNVGLQQALMIVKRDVTLNPSSSNVAAGFAFSLDTTEIRVGGNWTDTGTSTAGYGAKKGIITFNGGAAAARTVAIDRTGLITNFNVGDSTGAAGCVGLAKDLTTAGYFTVRTGSRLDPAGRTLTVGRFIGQPGFILDAACGQTTGVISVTEENGLKLAAFTLNLTKAGNWNNGDSLVLIKYTGKPIAAPTITLGNMPAGFSFDKVTVDNGTVALTNVKFAAEPASRDANVNGSLASTAP